MCTPRHRSRTNGSGSFWSASTRNTRMFHYFYVMSTGAELKWTSLARPDPTRSCVIIRVVKCKNNADRFRGALLFLQPPSGSLRSRDRSWTERWRRIPFFLLPQLTGGGVVVVGQLLGRVILVPTWRDGVEREGDQWAAEGTAVTVSLQMKIAFFPSFLPACWLTHKERVKRFLIPFPSSAQRSLVEKHTKLKALFPSLPASTRLVVVVVLAREPRIIHGTRFIAPPDPTDRA